MFLSSQSAQIHQRQTASASRNVSSRRKKHRLRCFHFVRGDFKSESEVLGCSVGRGWWTSLCWKTWCDWEGKLQKKFRAYYRSNRLVRSRECHFVRSSCVDVLKGHSRRSSSQRTALDRHRFGFSSVPSRHSRHWVRRCKHSGITGQSTAFGLTDLTLTGFSFRFGT